MFCVKSCSASSTAFENRMWTFRLLAFYTFFGMLIAHLLLHCFAFKVKRPNHT